MVPSTEFPLNSRQLQLAKTMAISPYGTTSKRIAAKSPCNEETYFSGPSQLTRVGDVESEDGFNYDIEEEDD